MEAFTPQEWRRGDMRYLRPAGLALHVVETIEFYISGRNLASSLGAIASVWTGREANRTRCQTKRRF